MSAPRSIMPILISKTIEVWWSAPLPAYSIATSRLGVVDMKANSTPPRTPYSLGTRSSLERLRLEMPRYTFCTCESLPSLTTALLIACSVHA